MRSILLLTGLLVSGCAGPRFVEVDRSGAVVAIPANTNTWPTYHRDKLDAMLRERFPNGYEIVSEEEVVTGSVAHTRAHTQMREPPRLMLAGAEDTTRGTRHGEHSAAAFSGISLPLGQAQQHTQETTTYRDVSEWRVHVRAKSNGA